MKPATPDLVSLSAEFAMRLPLVMKVRRADAPIPEHIKKCFGQIANMRNRFKHGNYSYEDSEKKALKTACQWLVDERQKAHGNTEAVPIDWAD